MSRIAGIMMIVFAGMGMLIGQPPEAAKSNTKIATSVGECKVCHSDPNAIGLRDYRDKCGSLDFVLMNESVTWETQDPHRLAYKALMSPISKQMGKKLKIDTTTATACLACHATDTKPATTTKELSQFVRSESLGIGCQGCHGVGKEWQSEHYRIEETPTSVSIPWRTKSANEKTNAGLINLRDTRTRAMLCVSCHVGSVNEGKIITHEMYAAGHPPLPPIDLGSFMHDQPAHWKSPHEHAFFQSLPSDKAESLFSYFPSEGQKGYAARQTVIGLLAALEAETQLMLHDAKQPIPSGLNYARLDCYACHHELKIPSSRQARGYDGPPGRPPMKAWIATTSRLIADELQQGKDFGEKLNTLHQAIYAKPFGDKAMINEAAPPVIEWSQTMMKQLSEKAYFTADRHRSLRDAFKKAVFKEHALADPEAALVTAWAYQSMANQKRESKTVRGGDWLKQLNALTAEDVKSLVK